MLPRNDERIFIKMPLELKNRLHQAAEKRKVTLSRMTRGILEDWLKVRKE